ncbi:MAG: hypothetical protein QXZ20_00370 [Candidatus Aenigmatarchaeota archaeon]
MRNLFINFFLLAFIITIISNFSYAKLADQDIEIEINMSEDYSIYLIKWKVYVDVNYYYPAGSEFSISLPNNYEIISVKDDFDDVEFKISNSSLIFYNRRNIHHGDNYRFYITIKQNYNPIYYNNSFYFKSFYSSIPMKINLPEWASNIKILSGKNYTIKSNSIFTSYPIFISFSGKEIGEELTYLELENINISIPKKYFEKLLPILEIIEKNYWSKFEEIFSNSVDKINFNLVKNEKDDWICYYHKNSISCGIEILFYEDDDIIKTILHEIVHHFISHTLGNGLAPWFEEGIAEKIALEFCNFTKNEIDRNKIMKECYSILTYDFWSSWTCEKFNNCNITYYFNNSCISDYGLDNLRYVFSLDIVNKTLDLEDIKEISKFFHEHNISISASSKNKDSIAVFLIYLFGKDYEEIKNYKINFDTLDKVKELYGLYNNAKEKIKIYSENLPKNIIIDVKYVIEDSLNIIFNGYFDEAEREIKEAIQIAESIKINAEKIKEDIENIEKALSSCYYSDAYSLILMANQSYNEGELNKSIEYINKALKEKDIIDKRINNIREKVNNFKSSFLNIIFSDRIKMIEKDFKNCRIEKAEKGLEEIEKKFEIVILSIIIFALSTVLILIYFVFRSKVIFKSFNI